MKIEDYGKYYINGSDHYLMPKGELIELFDEMVNWREESKQLKEVIDKAIEYIKENMYSYYDNNGEKCIEETVFERSADPKELLDILNEASECNK